MNKLTTDNRKLFKQSNTQTRKPLNLTTRNAKRETLQTRNYYEQGINNKKLGIRITNNE